MDATMTKVSWVLAIVTGLVFLAFGGMKFMSNEEGDQKLIDMGVPEGLIMWTGVIEVVGAILVIVPKTRVYGALVIGGTMLGAIYFHVSSSTIDGLMGFAIFMGILQLAILWLHRTSIPLVGDRFAEAEASQD